MIRTLLGPVDFYGRPRPVLGLHCYIIQAGTFALAAYLFMSWDFSGLALMPPEAFARPARDLLFQYWTTPWFYWTTLQFIYEIIPRPTIVVLQTMQIATIVALWCGLFGILPRLAAWVALMLGAHLIGMFLIGGDTMDASTTVLLFLLFVVALFPRGAYYQLGISAEPMALSTRFHGPVFILLLFMDSYYFFSGFNKIADVGIGWVLAAHTELWSKAAIENSLFVSSFSTSLWFNSILSIKWLAGMAALLIFALELLAPFCLFLPRWSPAFLIFFAAMHVSIYLSLGYGYWTNTGADLMLLPYTAIVARLRSHQRRSQAIGVEQPAE
ncbi:hypothetical protein J6500_16725 [Bradyrhizobium sp. WSM 1704]|uniref:hypothetical protein n=1 Tax=Bradyrhizobium semiaridum TaxID=2821404 RepID=UPI001CE32746|nr:hypothetical protein [Bradyrhizobium semiaridum]MCA6123527.1 hypothetical protein [Bradyrhizobium semiaridum]